MKYQSFQKESLSFLPLIESKVSAGFPSPADDYLEKRIDLNDHLIAHPTATFFIKVVGDSMIGAGIFTNDLLIVDRSLEAKNNSIVVAVVDGEFTVKRLKKEAGKVFLHPENPKYEPIEISESLDLVIWGIVIHVIRSFK